MKHSTLTALTALLAQGANAHYVFSRLVVNNTLSNDFQYVRDVAPSPNGQPALFAKGFPLMDGLSDPALVCGRSAFPVRNPEIQTATIIAGDDVSFHLPGRYSDSEEDRAYPPSIFHIGPGQVFLSKLPDGMNDLKDYDGKGDFFKIAYAGVKDNKFILLDDNAMNFTIPATTPPGKYLMRLEHWMVEFRKGYSQWYVACAHVEIKGSGGGTPTEFIRFPGAYSEEDPSILWVDPATNYFPRNASNGIDFTKYVDPKMKVWTG